MELHNREPFLIGHNGCLVRADAITTSAVCGVVKFLAGSQEVNSVVVVLVRVDSNNLIIHSLFPFLSMVMSDVGRSLIGQHDNCFVFVVIALGIALEIVLLQEFTSLEPGDFARNLVTLWWRSLSVSAFTLDLLVSFGLAFALVTRYLSPTGAGFVCLCVALASAFG